MYIGNGKVIEAKGHAYGVVETELKKRPWTTYGKLSWINYIIESKETDMLDRLCDKYGEDVVEHALTRLIETYIDDGNPAPWAVKEVEEAKELGLTDASRPEMFTTRQEAMIMCLRTYKKFKEDAN